MVMKSKKMRINKKNRRKSRKIQRGGGELLDKVNELLKPLKITLSKINTDLLRAVQGERERENLKTEIKALQGENNGNTIEQLIKTVTEAETEAEQEKTAAVEAAEQEKTAAVAALQQEKEASEKALKEKNSELETAVAEKEASLKEAKEKFETSKADNIQKDSQLKRNADDAMCTIDKSYNEYIKDQPYFLEPTITWGNKNNERREYDLHKIETLNLLFNKIVKNSTCDTSNKKRDLGFNIVNLGKAEGRCNFALPLDIKLDMTIEDFYNQRGNVDMGPPSSTFGVGDIYNIFDSSKYENINTIPVMSSVAYLTPFMRSGKAADLKKYKGSRDIISNPLNKYIEDNKNMNFMTQDIVYVYQRQTNGKHHYRAAVVLTKLMDNKKDRKLKKKLENAGRSNPCVEEKEGQENTGGNRKGSRNTKRRKRGGGLFSRNSRKGENIMRKRLIKMINIPIFNKGITESKPDDNYLIRYLDKSWGKLENKKHIVCRKNMVWIGWGDGSNLTRKWLIRDIWSLCTGLAVGELGIAAVVLSGAWVALITFAKTLLAGTFAVGLAATAPISVPLAAGAGLTALLLFKNKLPNKKILYAKIPLMKNVLEDTEMQGKIDDKRDHYLNDERFSKLKSGRRLDPKVCVNAIEVLTCEEQDLIVSWSEQRNMRKRSTRIYKRENFDKRLLRETISKGGKKQKNTKKRRRKRNH